MTSTPVPPHAEGSLSGAACAKQADVGLDRLLALVFSARRAMQAELRLRPPVAQQQVVARSLLLDALESYTSALSSRGLAAPPRLRDELALQRNLAGAR